MRKGAVALEKGLDGRDAQGCPRFSSLSFLLPFRLLPRVSFSGDGVVKCCFRAWSHTNQGCPSLHEADRGVGGGASERGKYCT